MGGDSARSLRPGPVGVRTWPRRRWLQLAAAAAVATAPRSRGKVVARPPAGSAARPLVGMEYETWFDCQAPPLVPTPERVRWEAARQLTALHPPPVSLNSPQLALALAAAEAAASCHLINDWSGREATPLLGTYHSSATQVIGRHAAWLVEAHVDFLLVDWSNNLGANWTNGVALGIMGATYNLVQTLLRLHAPLRIALLLGLDTHHAVDTTPFRAQVELVDALFLHPAAWRSRYQEFLGKPLLGIFTGPTWNPPPDWSDHRFTVRWVNGFNETTHGNALGYWSWIDRVPQITYRWEVGPGGSVRQIAEAVTVTAAYPGQQGWNRPDAGPRRHGRTYLEQWATAFEARPEVVLLCQWNEFAQPDQYDPERSNDMEPTALEGWGANGRGGWGYYYLDLTRTMVAAFKDGAPQPQVALNARVP